MRNMAGAVYAFGDFELDSAARRLRRNGAVVALADRHLGVLLDLVAHAGVVRSKDALVEAAWHDVAVTDNSLEQAISALRRVMGPASDGQPIIQTVPRQGYRFTADVARRVARATDASLDALLAPHRAFIEGRAALETLERDGALRARRVFEDVLRSAPDQAPAHVGLANACVMQFEMTRTDERPDTTALEVAAHHAREACRLDPAYGEGWATLGFVLDRAGLRADAAAASRRAVTIEPDNWRHQLRLASVSWGEERLRAARRTLTLLPGFPLAHWLAATVHVARQAFDEAERELAAGIAQLDAAAWRGRFNAVALQWLSGLLHLARGREAEAMAAFEGELARESTGHLYARECGANTWYAIGVLRLRQSRVADAREAFTAALDRVRNHPMARIALVAASQASGEASASYAGDRIAEPQALHGPASVDAALARAAGLVLSGSHREGAQLVDAALVAAAESSSAGWILPVEPLLDVRSHPSEWAAPLARLRTRAA
jgi:DNA-binding winged helix-turn-helix (wHTH) protein